MDSSTIKHPTPGRRRGRYSEVFKSEIIAACKAPGISTAAVAQANSLNANLVRRWVTENDAAHHPAVQTARSQASIATHCSEHPPTSGFIPLTLNTPNTNTDIRIKLRKGNSTITVYWPMAGAPQCLAALQDWLR